jgi:cyclopropane fatty-acyl-phospholipid synthase-like methyltransferase
MRILKSNLLADGKLFNDGRPVDLIQIETEQDFDVLLDNILSSGYYNDSYFDTHIDYREGQVKFDAFFLASILRFLQPRSLLELGCGRGDVLFLSGLDERVRVGGIEFSQDILRTAWPPLKNKIDGGDILEVCQKYKSQGIFFDTFCAFDLWEHLHPRKLSECIQTIVSLAEKDALFFFTIPAFGQDRVFGEIFPLELEENREKFGQRLPFDFLNAESTDPAIPANGHLIWAHTEWWQKQFEAHGLIRSEALERNIHTFFDEHLFYARKCFYIFYLNSSKARRRLNRLLKNALTLYKKWQLLTGQQERLRRFEKKQNSSFIDLSELKSTIHHAEFYMIADMKRKIDHWGAAPLHYPLVRPVMSRLMKWIHVYFDDYVKNYKKNHYHFED